MQHQLMHEFAGCGLDCRQWLLGLARVACNQALINLDVIPRHAGGGETLLESAAHSAAIKRQDSSQLAYRLADVVHNLARNAAVHDFRNRAFAKSENGRTAGHRLDHDQAKWFGPINRK
jgi:hypothetical protein